MVRVLRTIIVLTVVIGIGVVGYLYLGNARPEQAPDYQVLGVSRQTVRSTVSATGAVVPNQQAALSFRSAGRVAEVLVQEGSSVTEGQVLARLDARELELAVQQAEVGVETATLQLAQVQAGPSAGEIAAAEAQVASAQLAYEQTASGPSAEDIATARANLASADAGLRTLRDGPSQQEITVARSNLEQSRIQLEQAQSEYDKVAWVGGVGALPQARALEQATLSHAAAQANYELATQGATDSQIKGAEAQVVQARSALDRLLNSPTETDLAVAEAQVVQAQASRDRLLDTPNEQELKMAQQQVRNAELGLEQAQLVLDAAQLTAPFDGTVADVGIEPDTLAQLGLPAITLIDLGSFHVNVRVDEIDVTQVSYGQEVMLTLDALPDVLMPAFVSRVAPMSSAESGIVSFEVRVDIIEPDPRLRAGMTANVEIITSEHPEALVVPNRSIRIDRQNGRTYVERLQNGTPAEVDVEVGIRGEQYTEIVTGLGDGDQVIIRDVSSLQRLQDSLQGSGFMQ